MKYNHLVFVAIVIFSIGIFACGEQGASETSSEAASSMKDFGDDTAFQQKHELPQEIDFEEKGAMQKMAIEGQDSAQYYFVSAKSPKATLLVFHEWWGLNDHIKREAGRFAEGLGNVQVMALDLYDCKVADNRSDANTYMQSASDERIRSIIKAALQQIPEDHKVGTIGWCFGGGWSLKAAIQGGSQVDGCVMYYGMPVQDSSALSPLAAPVLGHFAEQDGWITPQVMQDFESLAGALDKSVTTYAYDADHAFANPSGERYEEKAAQKANQRSLAFLVDHLLD